MTNLPAAPVIRIVLADDQPLQRQGYRMVLDSQPDLVVLGEASDGAQVLALARNELTDVVLMDIQMPRVNGLVAANHLSRDTEVRALGPAPRVILLTAVEVTDETVDDATDGVFAVLFKDVAPEQLLATIRAAAASIPAEG
ncbi:response regulator [Lacisediminihabitans changchengi]|uniref:Response regulator transcription factor n=1 Tax=Lacisediminihabitans changchengi TaxID=2787634 RepID=A0A934W2A6_9MICO|nr:response regulator transcription factor [Lacisediminihabitans changchengi]MBK4346636.1 response regulator transcription factor [Lacisediminihabitans changchengi]